MYKRIFVPIDSGQASTLAFEEACSLAKLLNAELLITTVVDLTPVGQPGMEFVDAPVLHQSSKGHAKDLLSRALSQAQAAGLSANTKLLESFGHDLSQVLLEEAKQWEANLIVMGTHGRTGLMHLIMGSVAEGVLRRSLVPVLLVRKRDAS